MITLDPENAQLLADIRAWTVTHRSRHMRNILRWLEQIEKIVREESAPPAPPHSQASYALHPFEAPVLIKGRDNPTGQWLRRQPLISSPTDVEIWEMIQRFVHRTHLMAYDTLGKDYSN